MRWPRAVLFALSVLFAFFVLAVGGRADAAKRASKAARAVLEYGELGADARAILRARLTWAMKRAKIFEHIAKGDFRGQHVIYRDKHITAFLDLKDPKSVNHDPRLVDFELEAYPDLNPLPPERRAHIIVIPNKRRQHLNRTFDSAYRSADLRVSLALLEASERLAKSLGLRHARVFVNAPHRLSVGYLHVHIVGEREPDATYPRLRSLRRKSP